MKRLNVKFLLLLAIGLIAFCGTVYGLRSFQVSRNADSLTERAAASREEGDYKESIRLLQRYLRHRSDDLETWSQLATDCLSLVTTTEDFDRRDLQTAYSVVEDVLRRDPENYALRRKAIDFFMLIQRHSDVIAHIKLLHLDPELEDDPEISVKLARCYALRGDQDKAVKELEPLLGFDSDTGKFELSLATAPNFVDAYLLMAAIYYQTGSTDLLDDIFDQAVEGNPESSKALLERARHRRRARNDGDDGANALELAKQDVAEAFRLAPDDEQVILMAAEMAIVTGDLLKANEYLTLGLEKHPKSTAMFISRSDLARQEEGIPEALDWINQGLNVKRDDALLVLKRAELELASNDLDSARKSIQLLKLNKTRRDWVEYLEVRMLMLERNWLLASKKLEEIRARLVDKNPHLRPQVFISLVQCYEQLEQWDLVIQFANEVPDDSTVRFSALLAKASAYHRKNQYDQSAKNYEKILETYTKNKVPIDPSVSFSYLSMLIEQQKKLPNDKQDWSKVKEVVKLIRSDESLTLMQREGAAVQYVASRFGMEKAKSYGDTLVKKYPDDPQIAEMHHNLANATEDRTVPTVEADISTWQGRLQRISQIERQGDDDVTDQLLEMEQGMDDWNINEKERVWNKLAVGYLVFGEYEEVFRLWEMLAESDPNNLKVRVKIFELAFDRSDEERMGMGLDMIRELVGDTSNEWKLAEAMRLTWLVTQGREGTSRLEDARRLLREIEDNRPDWPSLLRLMASIAMMQSDVENALEYLERALDNGENDISIVQQLANIYIKLNRKDDALRVLDALDAGQQTKLVRRLRLTLQDKRVDLAEVDAVVRVESENTADLIWRGQLLAKHGYLKPAQKSFHRVTQLYPQLPLGWISYVDFLLNARKREAANKVMRAAQMKLPEQILYVTLARCHLMAASQGAPTPKERGLAIQQAESAYRQALQNDPEQPLLLQNIASFYLDIGQQTKADKYLDQLLDGAEPHLEQTPGNIAWARRSKAKILASSGSFQDYLQAMDEIRKNVPRRSQLGSADLKVLAEITLPRPDSLSQKKVIKELESLSAARDLTIDEKIFLARLYQRVDRTDDAERMLYALFVASPKNQQIVSLLIETLLSQDKLTEADQMLDKLPPNSLNRFRINALIYHKRGQSEKAAQELLQLIPRNLLPEQHELLRNIATLLEEIEQDDFAEKVWREYIQREPQQHLLLAHFLGRCQGLDKLDQAFEICGKALNEGGTRMEAIAQIGVSSLRDHMNEIDGAGVRSKYFGTVEKWFQVGFQRAPDSKSLKLQQAEFESLRGSSEEVITIYENFLRQEDLDDQQRALVQNNLAYLLALVNRGEEALGLVADAIKYLGPTPHLLDTRAMAKIAMGDFVDAQRDLNSALDEGDTASLRFHLAYATYMGQNRGGAEQQMRQAMELGINPHVMHPLERKIYDRMVSELDLQALAMK